MDAKIRANTLTWIPTITRRPSPSATSLQAQRTVLHAQVDGLRGESGPRVDARIRSLRAQIRALDSEIAAVKYSSSRYPTASALLAWLDRPWSARARWWLLRRLVVVLHAHGHDVAEVGL